MSEFINNREHRKEVLKEIIAKLHNGMTVDEVQAEFEATFSNVSAAEITEAEQALINEGLPVSEIQRLCDVHSAVFKGSIEEIHRVIDERDIPGHPVEVLIRENHAIEQLINQEIRPLAAQLDHTTLKMMGRFLDLLLRIDLHYSRKENLFFPYMEKYGISAPPKVMWGVDDEIRDSLKQLRKELANEELDIQTFQSNLEIALIRVEEMIFKEENILVPMLLETLTQEEWKRIADESDEIGFMIPDIPNWDPVVLAPAEPVIPVSPLPAVEGLIHLPSGVFKPEELVHMLNALPFDITFVDKDDTVKYFSQGAERIFTRTKAIIGRKVANCHPPGSVHIVEQILDDFKSGKKDHEDFWIPMKDLFVYIRYFAIRNEHGEYLGTLEVTQNIKPIQGLTGEKRLVSE